MADTETKTQTPAQRVAERIAGYRSRLAALKTERASWLSVWREIAQHQRPRAFRDNLTDTNRGDKKHTAITNSTPLDAQRTLAAGMMSGITSPSRPWFRLTLPDPKLNELPAVKVWLAEVERILRDAMSRSNFYKGLHGVYSDLGPFGTTAMYVEEDEEDGIRTYNFPIGSYCLAAGPRGNIDCIFREVRLTVSQVVRLFGLENCSTSVQGMHRNRNLDSHVDVVQVIQPNADVVPGQLGAGGMGWSSCWFEANADKPLREAGYEEFPVMCPRWEVTGEDVYGFGPGWQAQGDCKALQQLEKRGAQAAEKIVNPPMQVPASLKNSPVSLLPGAEVYVPDTATGQIVRPAIEINPAAMTVFGAQKVEHEVRIKRAYFADLWLMLSESDGTMTAREVIERREEKLLQLGTVLESLADELLDPVIDRVLAILFRRGLLPPPPQEIEGMEMRVEYISIMAQAQKLLGTTGVERLVSFVGGIAALDPTVLDNLDIDAIVLQYAGMLGVPPESVRPKDVIAAIRKARAAAQAKMQRVAAEAEQAKTVKTLSETDTEGNNALTTMQRGLGVA
ncbi:MAG: portal protein [Archangium sp.]|nr:portal protein [Archangium sp.]